MRKNVLIYGFILGTIMCLHMLYMVNLCYTNPDLQSNDVLGYAAMIIVFSLIFFGIRNYRNKQLNGFISFGRAFGAGSLIAVLASTMYVVVWLFYYYLAVPDFIDQYTLHVLSDATRNGADAKKLAEITAEMADFKEMYKSPVFVILITYFEVLPIALLVVLVSSLILKKKKRMETTLDA